jgi:hypothetical protein
MTAFPTRQQVAAMLLEVVDDRSVSVPLSRQVAEIGDAGVA